MSFQALLAKVPVPAVSAVKHGLATKTVLVVRFVSAVTGELNGGIAMTRLGKTLVNTQELGRAIRRRRVELTLSLRDVADETGVSASTLSRIENGTGKPDADNIARLTSWLDMPMERVLAGRHVDNEAAAAVVYFPHESTPEIVEAHLRADRNLTPETASALSELFRVAYTQFSHSSPDKGTRKRK